MRRIIVLLFIFFAGKGNAQFMDTLHEVFRQKSNIDARIETRWSVIDNKLATVQGVRLGVAFKRKLRLGGGVSWLKNDYRKPILTVSENNETVINYRYLKFVYMCFYADFVFHKTKRWQLSVPVQAGGGAAWYQDKPVYDLNAYPKYFIFFYEPGITVQFKIFRWLGVGSDVACRMALKDKKIGEHLSSPLLSLKVMIWPDQLFYILMPEHKISKKKGPAIW